MFRRIFLHFAGWFFHRSNAHPARPAVTMITIVRTVLTPPTTSRTDPLSTIGDAVGGVGDVVGGAGYAQILKPAPISLESEWNRNAVVPAGTAIEAGSALLEDAAPQYFMVPSTWT
jgi:hypothetical protein